MPEGLREGTRLSPATFSSLFGRLQSHFPRLPAVFPWKYQCLFSRTNIFSRLQQPGLGELAPARNQQPGYNIWGCRIRGYRNKVQAVRSLLRKVQKAGGGMNQAVRTQAHGDLGWKWGAGVGMGTTKGPWGPAASCPWGWGLSLCTARRPRRQVSHLSFQLVFSD